MYQRSVRWTRQADRQTDSETSEGRESKVERSLKSFCICVWRFII